MSGTHMHDFEQHLAALEADLEYYRVKRLESRMFFAIRRGLIGFADLLDGPASAIEASGDVEQRIRMLEDGLDVYVKGIGLTSIGAMAIEDNRKERGDYDPFFRFTKKHYEGSVEQRVSELELDLAATRRVLAAFTRALVRRDVVTEEQLEARRRADAARDGWRNGARIVARAWVDPEFKRNLIEHGREAVRELDIPPGRLGKLGVAENTEAIHNVVVCTLCSCYPHDLLGNPPWWYRHDSYKERIVRDPRGTLSEMFHLEVPAQVRIQVHDSTSDVRWMVLPRRPAGTERLTEEQLAELLTPESMVGVAEPLGPSI